MSIGRFSIETRQVDEGTAIVVFAGEMDLYTSPRAKETLTGLLAQGFRYLIINLHQAEYLDSTGLGTLIGALRRAREHGGSVRIVAPSHTVRRLFEMTRLTNAFPIDATEQDALAHLHDAIVHQQAA
ncbi:MAG TPA: STAS domain-containing protein [Armatimonadota bacterium]|jgi:anti-sigma B factor antagonist